MVSKSLSIYLTFPFLLVSCSHISYHSKGEIPISFKGGKNHSSLVELSGKKEFYLWGLLPKVHQVDLDIEFKKEGLESVSGIEIEEYQTNWDFFKEVFSFGLYIPKRYRIKGNGKRKRNN